MEHPRAALCIFVAFSINLFEENNKLSRNIVFAQLPNENNVMLQSGMLVSYPNPHQIEFNAIPIVFN